MLSCRPCNQQKGSQTATEFGYPELQATAEESLKSVPFMNLVRMRLAEALDGIQTWGYLTKYQRTQLGLPKSHVNDAFVIAGGTTQEHYWPYRVHQVDQNNLSPQKNRKGFKPAIRRQRYSLQRQDLVWHKGLLYRVQGVFNYGKWVRLVVAATRETINSKITNVSLVKYSKGFAFDMVNSAPP